MTRARSRKTAAAARPRPSPNQFTCKLRRFGNMSSATLVFVLDRIMRAQGEAAEGMAMAFGPGLSVETFSFHRA